MPTNIYHERQLKQLCALHSLNNLFQEKDSFTKEQLDAICIKLNPSNWLNPHRSMLGLGNYDINVIMTALQQRNYEAIWFDKRRDPACINLNAVFGFIVNAPPDYKFGFVPLNFNLRHWFAVRQIDGKYYNLDSKLTSPHLIGSEMELLEFFNLQLQNNDRELFLVMENNTTNDDTSSSLKWLREDSIDGSERALDVQKSTNQN